MLVKYCNINGCSPNPVTSLSQSVYQDCGYILGLNWLLLCLVDDVSKRFARAFHNLQSSETLKQYHVVSESKL